MEKETLNPDESFKTEGEYRPGRSSILKPQRPRTPFQEVTFRSVAEEFDLTNRRRRVSFAHVNIVKEFCSKTESQHIGNIEPYEETFAQSSDSSQYSNSVLSRNSTGLFISPAKQESPNSSVYNEESMELTSNSICEPSAMTQEQTKCFPNSMEKTCTDKSFDANMSMTNVLNFPYQITMPDKENLFKRNYLEMSDNDMEFTEAIPVKVANRTLNFPKDHESSVMEFTEVIPRRLMIAPTLEDRCQDLTIEDKNKRKPRKTLTVCDEVDEVSPCKNIEENQDAVDMSLVTTAFTGLNKWSFKPQESPDMTSSFHKLNVKTSINLKESDMSLVTASSTLLNSQAVPNACFEPKDDMSLVTASSALVNRLSVRPVQDSSENTHVKSREPDDMSLITASSTLMNRLSVKTAQDSSENACVKTNDDVSLAAASSMLPNRLSVKLVQDALENANDDMSLVAASSMFSNRLSVKPVQNDHGKPKDSDDISLVAASSMLPNRLSIKPVQDDSENDYAKPKDADDMSLIAASSMFSNRLSVKPVQNDHGKPKDSDDMSLFAASSMLPNRLSVKPVQDDSENDYAKPKDADDMSLFAASSLLPNRLSVKPVQDDSENDYAKPKDADDMSLIAASSMFSNRLSVKPVQNDHGKPKDSDDMSLFAASSMLPNRLSVKPVQNDHGKPKDSDDMSLFAASSMLPNRLSVKPVQNDHGKPKDYGDISLVAASSMLPNRLSVKPVQDASEDANVKLKEPDDMSLVTASSTLLNRLSVKPAQDCSENTYVKPQEFDDMSLVTASSALLNRLSVKPVQDTLENAHAKPEDSDDIGAASSMFSNRLSVKPVQDETETTNAEPKDHDDMSLITASSTFMNRLSVKPVQDADMSLIAASSMFSNRLSVKPVQDASEDVNVKLKEHDDMSLVTASSTFLNRLSAKPAQDDSENTHAKPQEFDDMSLVTASSALLNRLSVKPVQDTLENAYDKLKDSDDMGAASFMFSNRLSVKPVQDETETTHAKPKDHDDMSLVTASSKLLNRLSVKPSQDASENIHVKPQEPDDMSLVTASSTLLNRLSVKPVQNGAELNLANIPAVVRKSIKPTYNQNDEITVNLNRWSTKLAFNNQDESLDMSLMTTNSVKLASVDNLENVAPISRKSVKSHEIATNFVPNPAARLSVNPFDKEDSLDDSLGLVEPETPRAARKSIKPCYVDDSLSESSMGSDIDKSPIRSSSVSEPCENLPNIQNISLEHTEPNWQENIETSVTSLHNSETRRECVLEKSLIPGVIPLSPCEKTKQSFMDCETEKDDYKVSFKYIDDLKAVSFAQSTIHMDLNDSSVMDEDFEQEPKESTTPISDKTQELMCITPYGKECNISKAPREALFKTPKSENSTMDKFELYNLEKKSIEYMEKLGFKWMSFLKWKLEIYDHFYLVIELSQTLEITNATRINKLYFFRGPYVKEGDILDFVENNFRANFPNLECSIIENITKIQKVLFSFWKELEPIVKPLRNLRLYYPYTLKDNKMIFTVDDIDKEIIFDVTIDLNEWRTGIKKEHIYVDQCFGTVSEHLVKHLFQPNIDFIKYIIDLKKYAFL